MRWQHVLGHEQVVSNMGDPETKLRHVSSLVWLDEVLVCLVSPPVGLKLVH